MRLSVSVRRLGAALTGVAAVAAAAFFAVAATPVAAAPGEPAPPSKQRTILNDVHTDVMYVESTGDGIDIRTRIGSGGEESFADPADVLMQLFDTDTSRITVPDLPDYAFLGAPGTTVWMAPEIQDFSLVWPGFSTEGVQPGVLAGDAVEFHLRSIDGPGRVEVFASGPVGEPLRYFSSADPAYRTKAWPVMSHAHANWVFTAQGRYVLTFEATATLAGGQAVNAGPVELTWYVGGASAADIPVTSTATTLGAPASSAHGEPVTLTGTVEPAGAAGWVEFLDGTTVLGHEPIAGGTASMTVSGLASGDHQLSARFVPRYSTDFTASASAAVTHRVTGGPGGPSSSSPGSTSSTSPPTSPTTAPPTTTTTTTTTKPPGTTAPAPRTSSCVPTSTTTGGVVIANGHADLAVRIESGQVVTRIKDGTAGGTPTWRAPGGVVFHLTDAAKSTVPAGPFEFIGGQGATVWQIPQTQKPGVPWLGWNTEEVSGSQVSGAVTWRLTAVQGPGTVAIFEYDAFGQPKVIMNSKDGLPDSYDIPLGTHAHGNWAFTQVGVYRLTVTHTAKLASGTTSTSTGVVTLAVGSSTSPNGLATGTTTTTGCGNGALPRTGMPLSTMVGGGAVLVAGGAALLALTYRRRRGTS